MTLEVLLDSIQLAFATTPHPGANHITNANCCAECDALAAWYGVRSWQHVRDELRASVGRTNVDHSPSMLFVPAAFHYFIPAFLLHSIDPFDAADTNRLYACVFPLVPLVDSDPGSIEAFKRDKLPWFDRQQRQVIADYLEFLLNVENDSADFYRDQILFGHQNIWNS